MKRNYVRVTIVGFVTLYLMFVGLSTYLTKMNFEKDFENQIEQVQRNLQVFLGDIDSEILTQTHWPTDGEIDTYEEAYELKSNLYHYMSYALSYSVDSTKNSSDYQQISAAIYDCVHGEIVAQSDNIIAEIYYQEKTKMYDFYSLDEMFSEDELKDFVKEYIENPEVIQELEVYKDSMDVRFPYLAEKPQLVNVFEMSPNYDYKAWEKWQSDTYLQNFPKNMEERDEEAYYSTFYVPNWYEIGDAYLLCVRQTANPWLAAVDEMKFVYIWGLVFIGICIYKSISTNNKYYKQRMALEETRRDFTNAIAHELKTPLGIIRGFAENSLEHTVEEKREYYLQQIIGQTEEMDKLVKEMIYISKLDSDQMILQKESLSLATIVKEQLSRLQLLVEEKNLDVRWEVSDEFLIDGDKQYLERAIWNLLINAIEYNHQDGIINISVDKNQCKIENTGTKIAEEDLPKIFDMFYTGDKSRTAIDKHMGLGLYLTKKILTLHKLNISIQNTEIGVEATIYI